MITTLKKLFTGAAAAKIVPEDGRVVVYVMNSKIDISHRISLDITSLFSDVPPEPVLFRKDECVALKKALKKGSQFSMVNGQLAVDGIPVLFSDDQFDLPEIYDGTETNNLAITPEMVPLVKEAASRSAKHKDHRAALTGVYFDAGQGHVAATNGTTAVVCPFYQLLDNSGSIMLDPEVAKGLIRGEHRLLWNDKAYVLVYPDGRRHEQKMNDHFFPLDEKFLNPIVSREEITLRFYAKPLVEAYLTAFDRDEILTLRKQGDLLSFAIGSTTYKKFRISSEGDFFVHLNPKLLGKDPTGVWGIVPKTNGTCVTSPITVKSLSKTIILLPYVK